MPNSQNRLTKSQRREQLLDVAAGMLVERGPGSLTMEGIAASAGVSKALPYQHFENADDVLIALRRREIQTMGARIYSAVEEVDGHEDGVRAAVHAYFDAVAERGRILALLTAPGAPGSPDNGRDARVGHSFVADVFGPRLGLTTKQALLLANFSLAIMAGAMDAWAHRDGRRKDIERVAVDAILEAARSVRSS